MQEESPTPLKRCEFVMRRVTVTAMRRRDEAGLPTIGTSVSNRVTQKR